MNITELIELVKSIVISDEDIIELNARLEALPNEEPKPIDLDIKYTI
jgi:hypothetical protein